MILSLAFSLLLACGDASSPAARITTGECEGSPYGETTRLASDADTGDPASPAVAITAEEGVLVLDYQDMTANCCPSPGVQRAVEGGRVTVDLRDVTAETACGCVCITDFRVEVPDLEPGAYEVRALFNGEEVGAGEVVL